MASCFALRAGNTRGFPLQYVSRDFEDLFGYTSSECIGQNCGTLIGGPSVLNTEEHAGALAAAASDAGLTFEQALEGVKFLTAHVGAEEERAFAGALVEQDLSRAELESSSLQQCRRAVMLAKRKNGELLVCELLLGSREHPVLGWQYCVSFHHDITAEVSVGDLLTAVVEGTYDKFMAQRGPLFQRRLDEMGSESNCKSLDDKAGEMWQGLISGGFKGKKKSGKSKRSKDECSMASRSTTASGISVKSGISVASSSANDVGTEIRAPEAPGIQSGSARVQDTAASREAVKQQQATGLQGYHVGHLIAGAVQHARPVIPEAHITSAEELAVVEESVGEFDSIGDDDLDVDAFASDVLWPSDGQRDSQEGRRYHDLLDDVEGLDECSPHGGTGSSGFFTPRSEGSPAAKKNKADRRQLDFSLASTSSADSWRGKLEGVWNSLTAPRSLDLCLAVDALWRKEVYDLDFALTISDPCLPGCPIVLCSAGFDELTGYADHEVIGQDSRTFLLRGVPPEQVNTASQRELHNLFKAAARRGAYACNEGSVFHPLESSVKGSTVTIVDGELLFLQTGAQRSGDLFQSMQYWKHVQLDEKHYVVGLQTPVAGYVQYPEENTAVDFKHRCLMVLRQLAERMTITEQVLASQFWYQAAMRRQVQYHAPYTTAY